MTFVFAHYKANDEDNTFASISQDKYCSAYKMDIYHLVEPGSPLAYTTFTGHYSSKKTARQAMNRFAKSWTRID